MDRVLFYNTTDRQSRRGRGGDGTSKNQTIPTLMSERMCAMRPVQQVPDTRPQALGCRETVRESASERRARMSGRMGSVVQPPETQNVFLCLSIFVGEQERERLNRIWHSSSTRSATAFFITFGNKVLR